MLSAMQPIATDVTVRRMWSVCMSVCLAICYILHPAKAIGWNVVPLHDTHVVPSNTVLYRAPPWEGEIWGRNFQFAAVPPIVKLLGPC